MPVSYDAVFRSGFPGYVDLIASGADGKHVLINETTRLSFLSDTMHPPYFLGQMAQIVSIGDVIIAFGLFMFIFEVVTNKNWRLIA